MVENAKPERTQHDEPAAGEKSGSTGRMTKGQRTKRRLMTAARDVLSEKGYLGIRVEDIASAAGVAKGTFYLYFDNKEDVIMAVMKEELSDGVQAMLSSRTVDDPFLEILEPNVSYARTVFEKPGLLRAFVQFANDHPEASELWSEVTRGWVARIEAKMDHRLGTGRTDEATRVIATYAMSWMFDGIFLSIVTREHPRLLEAVGSPEQLAETLSVLWYRAVYGVDPDPERLESARAVLDFHLEPDRNGETNP